MTVWSRISEAVQGLGGGLGQLLGAGDKPPEKTVAFTIGMIALGAKMAKADGVVTDDEVKAFGQIFTVPEKERSGVERVFNLAKQDIAGFETYAEQVAKLFAKGSSMLENVLDGLFHIAKADGLVHEHELEYLAKVSAIFGFSDKDFARIRSRHVVIADDPYEVLGLSPTASASEVKQQYRKLARDLHPDRQVADGMPKEMVLIATERLARVNSAYAQITKGKS
jgi:DnaJ like chaperone protein